MWRFWWPPLARLGAVALAGLIAALASGAATGWAVAALGFLALIFMQLGYVDRLHRWLRAPEAAELPEAWGVWREVFRELHRLRRAENRSRERLTRTLERFLGAVQALPDGVILLDVRDRIDWCNDAATRQFGIVMPNDRGQPVANLLRYRELVECLQSGSTAPVMLRTHAATPLTLAVQIVPFAENEKLVIARDVTGLERIDIMRRDFIANVSHELRTPLTVISGFLEHLAGGQVAPADATRQIALMEEQSTRMMRLVEDLLTLSRLEAADNVLPEHEVDVPGLVGALLEEAKSLSKGRHLITADVGPKRLRGSEEELRAAFSNLVSNAVRYTPDGGRIALRWVADDSGARFSVADTGIGIAPEHLPRLTERFYRVDRGRSRETGGTGLGLAIVKHVMLRHDAQTEIESEAGRGSTFTCAFPATRVIAERRAATVTG
jgi:two-component system phosphate regulon sensor histidine kinase PhoR